MVAGDEALVAGEARLGRSFSFVALLRLGGAVIIGAYIVLFDRALPPMRPDYVVPIGLALAAIVAVTALVQISTRERYLTPSGAVYIDGAVALSLLFLDSWEPDSFIFMATYLVALEAGLILRPRDTLYLVGALSIGYVLQESFAATIMDTEGIRPVVVALRVLSLAAVGAAVTSITTARRAGAAYREERAITDALRAADEMKTAFLRAVSHELRTPLTAITGFAHILAERGSQMTPEQQAAVFASMASSAAKLETLFGELLDLDRLSRGVIKPELSRVDLLQLAHKVVNETDVVHHPIRVAGTRLEADVDAPKVERIVHNLLLNAIKHTPPDTPIEVRVEPNHSNCVIVVEDRGEGVPDPLKQAIFEPFRQGGPSSPGTGIGLSLVSKFAELHGGRAWVEDGPSGGAAFKVELPVGVPPS